MDNARSIVSFLQTRCAYCVAIGACLCLAAVSAAPAKAQAGPNQNVSVSFNRTSIQSALRDLFTQVGLNYSLEPGVTGNVTASLHDVPFSVALGAVLNANRPQLVYEVRDGVYMIHPRSAPMRPGRAYPRRPYARRATSRSAFHRSSVEDIVRIPLDYANAAILMQYALGGGIAVPPSSFPGEERGARTGTRSLNSTRPASPPAYRPEP